ncbi:MAG: atpF [Paenibacillaceae bacterium]|nr:atpF [Paenibacillaceae bacterium]
MISLGTLHLELGTMLVQLICFLVLMWLVAKFAMKPAMKVLKDRQNYIDHQISSAESANQEAAKLVEEQRQLLESTRKEAHAILEQAKQQKDREGDQIIHAAQERAERVMKDALAEIENEKIKAIAELREEVGALSVQLASKIIEKEVDASAQRGLIDDFLQQVGGRI